METVGHHTCRKEGGREWVLENAPFLSPKGTKSVPFLGVGYYFWDDDLGQAKKWGVDHYRNNFYVVAAQLDMPEDVYLDLAGNRQHTKYFLGLLERFARKGVNAQKWNIGEFIEAMKEFRKADYSVFPFEIVRAQDFLPQNKDYVFYFNDLPNYTNLNPRFIICLFIKSEVYLQNKRVVFER